MSTVHGTRYAYLAKGCRCTACRNAGTQYQRKTKAKLMATDPAGWLHGENSTYQKPLWSIGMVYLPSGPVRTDSG